ncbi:hypothetical protein [Rhizobium rhizogenes]|uniref:Uncharacterized protein n=1 Tax=Rhizobium rhizogenes TaxID=359 RepID=A0AA92H842_RHIRH|nr:hypothetical protein [Rhizobium rhizogenes]PVE51481.1 hypothetical protein DC430_18240 [Rhizobium rhizogenes]PVE67819.1 hypothetical protein DC415_04345 [Agrobacterium tumefaciens]PVE77596.1 hypothetical protein DCP16_04345 [Sphingomonas sp. TPD3009]
MAHTAKTTDQQDQKPDIRDRLIVALYAQLKAERETREAMEWVARHGGLSPDVMEAMASDPVPVFSQDDVVAVERIIDRERFSKS